MEAGMREISFNTVSRVVNTIQANRNNLAAVPLERVKTAACSYDSFLRKVVNFLRIEAGKQYYARLDEQKELFATKLMLKLQRVFPNTDRISIDLPANDTVYKIQLVQLNDGLMEFIIDGISHGKIEGNLVGLKNLCMRRYFK
jgi:hypothetical protein